MKRTARLKITVADLRMLYKALCKHREKYNVPTNPYAWNWADCTDCVLGKIKWQPLLGFGRNLCFRIWHDKILESDIKN